MNKKYCVGDIVYHRPTRQLYSIISVENDYPYVKDRSIPGGIYYVKDNKDFISVVCKEKDVSLCELQLEIINCDMKYYMDLLHRK